MIFDKQWFKRNQKFLLWYVNTAYGKGVMHIDTDQHIINIQPNSISWRVSGNQYATEFRTHDKYSKRLYYSYKIIWQAFHWFDMNIANKYYPEINLGFDTLTVYPKAYYNHWQDALVSRTVSSGGLWADIHDGAGTYVNRTATITDYVAIQSYYGTTKWRRLLRSLFSFDTDTIEGIIDSATLTFTGNGKEDALSITPSINVVSSAPNNTEAPVAGDYSTFGTTLFSTKIDYSSWNSSGANDFILNASGLANIDVDGITSFGLREAEYDITDIEPTGVSSTSSSAFSGYYAEYTGTASDPKLVVVYSSGSTTTFTPIIMTY